VAVRRFGGARLRRAARGRPRLLALATALYLAAGALSTWPALRHADESFLAEGQAGHGEAAPGDHLQAAYQLWLPGHQLEQGAAPWRDPYSFQPEAKPRVNFAGWPFGLAFWPLQRLLGTVGAWNALLLLSYAGAGLLAFLWLESLGLPRGAALAGGLVFALAPYRAAQSSMGHLLAPVSMLLPLALWAFERRRTILAAAALASIPLSGQVHLALGAIPFFLVYAAARRGWRSGALAGIAAVAAGVLVYAVSIRGSVGAGGRSFGQVERYSADLADLVSRDARHGFESFVFLGWLVPLLALTGIGLLARERRRLALVLGLGAVLPVLLALGANLPLYEPLWRHLPGLRETRVPERFLPIACLCLAALVAYAVARVPRAVVVAVLALVALDLRAGVELFHPTAANAANRAYAARPAERTILELPVFLPDRQEGSVYQYYAIQAPGPRVGGYSTVAPRGADRLLRALKPLACGRLAGESAETVVVHRGLYHGRPRCLERLLRSLRGRYAKVAHDGAVTLYRIAG
jgi:hypothetical protein